MGRHIVNGKKTRKNGFTLIELLMVIAIVGILAGIAIPLYQNSVIKAKEAALKEDLYKMRDLIDKYCADKGKYPESLNTLVEQKYMRNVPIDPFTGRNNSWTQISANLEGGVSDVHSGSNLTSLDGTPYSEW